MSTPFPAPDRRVAERAAFCSGRFFRVLPALVLCASVFLLWPLQARPAEPVEWRLSPEATHLFYHLLLAEAVATDNNALLRESLDGLLRQEPSREIFQDGATLLLAQNDPEGARRIAERGLLAYPDDAALTILLAGAYSEGGDTDRGVGLLERYVSGHTSDIVAIQELIRLYLQSGKTQEAVELLSGLPRQEQSTAVLFFQAKLLASINKRAEASALLRTLVQSQPEFTDAWVELGSIAEQEHQLDQAVDAYSRALETSPENPEVWFRLVNAHLLGKDLEKALSLTARAPEDGPFLVQLGLLFADAGYNREALDVLQSAVEAGAEPEEVAFYRSIILWRLKKDPEAALEPLSAIPPESPLYEQAVQRKVSLLLEAGTPQKAYETARAARMAQPDGKAFWGLEAYALIRMNRPDEAEALIRKALDQYPADEELLFALGHIQDEAGKKAAALATMEGIIAANPRHARALNYVGYTLAERNTDLERALALITAALEESPDADYIVDSLAWTYYRMGDFEKAWSAIRQCIALGGDDPTIWEHYGDIALAVGDKSEAARGYREALSREPENPKDLRRKLSGLR